MNINLQELQELNNLTSNVLQIGQILKIPKNTREQTTYTVKENDTLYSIANYFNKNINTIKELNNLTSNYITKGQKLILS